jgi:hypothetical protein
MADIKEKTIPAQHEGGKKDIEHAVTAVDLDDARKLFVIARNRLLDVNQWHELAGTLSAKFTLTDAEGNEVDRTAEIHDHFKIDLPAPGPVEGKGYDWVYIEAIEDKSDSTGPNESIAIRVRPTSNPREKGENIAHFFNEQATSSFVVERKGKDVTASVFGRNEVPNTETKNVTDKVRNAVVGLTALLGFSNVQWKALCKGLIAMES